MALRKNSFGPNLFNQLTDASYLWADNATWERRVIADSAYDLDGNELQLPALPVDPGFADAALARLFTLPSRISKDEWKSSAAAIGSSASPVETAPPEKPATPAGSSIDDLFARLNRADDKLRAAVPKPVALTSYCRVFDYRKALSLFRDASQTGPGAHQQKLSVSFPAALTAGR